MSDESLVLEVLLGDAVIANAPLGERGLSIGRDAACDVVLEHATVSREHCRIERVRGELTVVDLDSASGVRLNGARVSRARIAAGDALDIGRYRLVLRAPGGAAGAPQAPADRAAQDPAAAAQDPAARAARYPAASSAADPAAGPPAADLSDLHSMLHVLERFDLHQPPAIALGQILEAMRRALDAERALLYRVDPRGRGAALVARQPAMDPAGATRVSERLLAEVARTRAALLIDDLDDADPSDPSLERLAAEQVRSVVIAPALRGERLVGVVYVDGRKSRRAFTRADLELLERALARLAGLIDGVQTKDQLETENRRLSELLRTSGAPIESLCTPDSAFAAVLGVAEKAAASGVTVLLNGETGSGKEEVARYLHRHSPRREGPWVAINCGALPESLVESELFGHRKGAFTGASEDRKGLIELAHKGTLFLDEVAELPLTMQVRLLRVLETRRVVRLGGAEEIAVDFRLVAASHRDLAAEVERGTFRQDLFYRLNVLPIRIPALRERAGDLPLLAEHFLGRLAPALGSPVRRISAGALERLARHSWPGNVRELRNTIERMLVLAEGEELTAEQVPAELTSTRASAATPADRAGVRPFTEELADFEADYMERLRHEVGDSMAAMSDRAGMSRFALYRKLSGVRPRKPGAC